MALGFMNRFLGAFWMIVGGLMAAIALAYVIAFDSILATILRVTGGFAPVLNWLSNQFGPGLLTWWILGLAVFVFLLGARLLSLSPASRPVAMAFHLLAGLFFLIITVVLFLIMRQATGLVGVVSQDVSRILLIAGLAVSVLLLAFGALLGSRQAWSAFTTARIESIIPKERTPSNSTPRPVSGPPARLVNLDTGEAYPLKGSPGVRITLGGDSTRTIVIDYDPSVSGEHAYIEFDNGYYQISDDASTNGTYVNGTRVVALPVRLGPKDEIWLGRARLRFDTE